MKPQARVHGRMASAGGYFLLCFLICQRLCSAQDALFYRIVSTQKTLIMSIDPTGTLSWSNAAPRATCRIESTPSLNGGDPLLGLSREIVVTGSISTVCLANYPYDEKTLRTVVAGNSAFALDLYQKLAARGGNVFFSPFSISSAFAMVYAGARGETARQIESALHFFPDRKFHAAFAHLDAILTRIQKQGHVRIHTANSLWPDIGEPLLPEYRNLLDRYYGAPATPLDFQHSPDSARKTINQWVSTMTAGNIDNLLPQGSISLSTRLVLANAVYFKGKWIQPFSPSYTHPWVFHRLEQGDSTVEMMFQPKASFKHMTGDTFQAVELPYIGKDISMLVLLPRDTYGLPALERTLTPQGIENIVAALQSKEILLGLPKFQMNYANHMLVETLAAMSISDVFSPVLANLSGMNGKQTLFLERFVHQAVITLNETGTEAAASSGIGAVTTVGMPPPTFIADHPFLFIVREKGTGSILFMGRAGSLSL